MQKTDSSANLVPAGPRGCGVFRWQRQRHFGVNSTSREGRGRSRLGLDLSRTFLGFVDVSSVRQR